MPQPMRIGRNAVHIVGHAGFIDILMNGKTFNDFPYLEQAAEAMLEDLIWWGTALRVGRSS